MNSSAITDERLNNHRPSESINSWRVAAGGHIAFILTGLNGTSGKRVTSVVAETLGQLGVSTMAMLPGRREAEAVRSLGRLVDDVFEIPYEPFWDQARTPQGWQKLLAAEVAKVCRSASFELRG